MSSKASLLASIGAIIDTLANASVLLAEASGYADQDRLSFSPLSILSGPLKYWKWHKAKKTVEEAVRMIDALRDQRAEIAALPIADLDFSKLDALNDITDTFPFSLRRVSTKGGPSPIKQQLDVETTVLHQIETTKLGVEHLLSEVGLLHAKIRSAS